MRKVLRLHCNVTPLATPRPWLHCSRCETRRPFVCSEKFRVNAQKKRLDAWLIYRCAACAQSWNLPLYERCRVQDIAPADFAAMTANSEDFARRQAFDLARLRRHSDRVDEDVEAAVETRVVEAAEAPERLVIAFHLPRHCRLRLDRLIARAAGLSRSRVRQLYDSGALSVAPASRAPLRQDARDGQEVVVDLR